MDLFAELTKIYGSSYTFAAGGRIPVPPPSGSGMSTGTKVLWGFAIVGGITILYLASRLGASKEITWPEDFPKEKKKI